mmetsp:Transcript_3701/g.5440  ORF Transcript_3701/g.5440 Transcript_3701/m.5440 type:complete len:187 (+) Transcript_3701:21-581(+)
MRFHHILSTLSLVLCSGSALNLRSAVNRITNASVERQLVKPEKYEFDVGFCTKNGYNSQCSKQEEHDLRTIIWHATQAHFEGAVVTKLKIKEVPELNGGRMLNADDTSLEASQVERILAGETWWFGGTFICHTCFDHSSLDPHGNERRRESGLGESIAEELQTFVNSNPDFCMQGDVEVQVIIDSD